MLRHAMVSDMPDGLSVQPPPPPGKLAAQLKSLLAILAVLGTTILSNVKRHFGLTDQNDQTGQSGPPSELVLNITVRPN